MKSSNYSTLPTATYFVLLIKTDLSLLCRSFCECYGKCRAQGSMVGSDLCTHLVAQPGSRCYFLDIVLVNTFQS